MKVTCSGHPESYIKCIQLMYSYDTTEYFNFTDVDEALDVLPVASEVMFRDCMESCMRYLAVVRWSREQEAKLRVVLSSLNINVLPDLAARLDMNQSKSDCEHLKMLKESLPKLLQITYYGSSEFRSTVEQHMFDYFKLNTSPAIKDACRDAILNQFKADVKDIKKYKYEIMCMDAVCSDLSWLLGIIRRCDAKLFATVVKEFCEDTDLRNAVGAEQYDSAANDMLILINHILEAMGNGEIITPMSFRVDFLTHWTDTMVKLVNSISPSNPVIKSLEKGITGVGETLPLVEQKRIYSVCQAIFTGNFDSASGLFKWWAEKVHDAIILDQL